MKQRVLRLISRCDEGEDQDPEYEKREEKVPDDCYSILAQVLRPESSSLQERNATRHFENRKHRKPQACYKYNYSFSESVKQPKRKSDNTKTGAEPRQIVVANTYTEREKKVELKYQGTFGRVDME